MKSKSITSIEGVLKQRDDHMLYIYFFAFSSLVFTIFSFYNLFFITFVAISVAFSVMANIDMRYWDLRYWDLMKCKGVQK